VAKENGYAGVAAFLPAIFAYFRLNFSTRPAESTSRCLPVKKPWQLEQTSTFISFLVERVSKLLPHTHLTTDLS
jgi:hypothetical protein